jgi:hypothetical protein
LSAVPLTRQAADGLPPTHPPTHPPTPGSWSLSPPACLFVRTSHASHAPHTRLTRLTRASHAPQTPATRSRDVFVFYVPAAGCDGVVELCCRYIGVECALYPLTAAESTIRRCQKLDSDPGPCVRHFCRPSTQAGDVQRARPTWQLGGRHVVQSPRSPVGTSGSSCSASGCSRCSA